MSSEEGIRRALEMLLSMCDRHRAEMGEGWDTRKTTIFYLDRNMELARAALKDTSGQD